MSLAAKYVCEECGNKQRVVFNKSELPETTWEYCDVCEKETWKEKVPRSAESIHR